MGQRSFDGVDDYINFGSDASIEGFTQLSVLLHLRSLQANSTSQRIFGKWAPGGPSTKDGFEITSFTFGGSFDAIGFEAAWTTTTEYVEDNSYDWRGADRHYAVTYDGGSTSNNPNVYVDDTLRSNDTNTTPAGTLRMDGASGDLIMGRVSGGTSAFFNGRAMCLEVVFGIVTAEQRNRHRWWGRVGGAVPVRHPMWTDKLANEGTATADGTATGSTMTGGTYLARVQRPNSACMGMGCGW